MQRSVRRHVLFVLVHNTLSRPPSRVSDDRAPVGEAAKQPTDHPEARKRSHQRGGRGGYANGSVKHWEPSDETAYAQQEVEHDAREVVDIRRAPQPAQPGEQLHVLRLLSRPPRDL